MSKFKKRSFEREQMDDLNCGGQELVQTLKELKTINHLLGGNQVSTDGLEQLIGSYPQPHYQIADIGCGQGDMIKVMARWAEKNRIHVTFHAIDANPNIIALAKKNLEEYPNVEFHVADVFDTNLLDRPLDIITCTLFTHHFTDTELITMLKNFKANTQLGFVINDLHRHPLAYYSIKLLTKLFSKSPMVKNDGPISVLRSFKEKELEEILNLSGWERYSIKWNWAFRWQVLGLH
ncbi:methyltransferase domain-containing protein [Litoribacter ruber]|uniref:Methyltransferase domain-containing protein n=1 Tax=Litoribacter ruber TaxID=702568 RepID=A0AAP2CF52_9BACT|nr:MULTISPECIES: methyltransferase domain-containing protein [Litoribacter]MBS9523426.1 methyltransferase domain-containing protein [Litoribacter alkaliphilus]MBT0812448.1 methyltransferase domain-containing protein [Litoribacter ruber]